MPLPRLRRKVEFFLGEKNQGRSRPRLLSHGGRPINKFSREWSDQRQQQQGMGLKGVAKEHNRRGIVDIV
jgi:hypothetical protein